MGTGPDGRIPVTPLGPEWLEFLWGISKLDSSWQSLTLVLSTIFGAGVVAQIVIYAVQQNIPSRFRSVCRALSIATTVAVVAALTLILLSWFDKDSLDAREVQIKAVEVQRWLQTSGYPRVTYQQGLELVCEHHHDKSPACGTSTSGVILPGDTEETVIRRDTNGRYMLVNAGVASRMSL